MGGDVRSEVGRILRGLRQDLGLSLKEVEERTAELGLRLPRSTINDIESGRSSLPVEALATLGSVFGVGTLDLLSEVVARLGRGRVQGETVEDLARRGQALLKNGGDLEAAWHFDAAAKGAGDVAQAARMSLNASHAYFMAGAYALSLHRVERVLDADGLPAEVRLSALARYANLLACLGRNGRARDALELVRAARRDMDEGRAVRYSLVTECWALLVLGDDPRTARDVARRAAKLCAGAGEPADQARALAGAALAGLAAGDVQSAIRDGESAVGMAEGTDDAAARVVAAVATARLVLSSSPRRVVDLLAFAAESRAFPQHRAEFLAAWRLLERVAVAGEDYRQAERWRRRARRVVDPVARRVAACYLRGLGDLEGEER